MSATSASALDHTGWMNAEIIFQNQQQCTSWGTYTPRVYVYGPANLVTNWPSYAPTYLQFDQRTQWGVYRTWAPLKDPLGTPETVITLEPGIYGRNQKSVGNDCETVNLVKWLPGGDEQKIFGFTEAGSGRAHDSAIAYLGTPPAVQTHRLIYKANNGTSEADRYYSRSKGEKLTIEDGSAFTPPSGKTFVGWSTNQSGPADDKYKAGSEFTMGDADITLYAQWTSSGTTIACAPQTGADPAASIWQASALLMGVLSVGLAAVMMRLRRRLGVRMRLI